MNCLHGLLLMKQFILYFSKKRYCSFELKNRGWMVQGNRKFVGIHRQEKWNWIPDGHGQRANCSA